MNAPTIGVSDFARKRHTRKGSLSYYNGEWDKLIKEVRNQWDLRKPGDGEATVARKVLVPVNPTNFVCNTIKITDRMANAWISPVKAKIVRRQPEEDPYITTSISKFLCYIQGIPVEREKAEFANVVCYHKDALTENGGERSTSLDWEIVCLIAGPVEREPMKPLTMARNQLVRPGGTASEYSAKEYAESVYYWSLRI